VCVPPNKNFMIYGRGMWVFCPYTVCEHILTLIFVGHSVPKFVQTFYVHPVYFLVGLVRYATELGSCGTLVLPPVHHLLHCTDSAMSHFKTVVAL
jgi:hypothetical protein